MADLLKHNGGTFSLPPKVSSSRMKSPIPIIVDLYLASEPSMPIARHKPRHSWIALAAFVGALLTSSGVSASCTKPDAGACPPVCGCCKTPGSDSPTPEAAGTTTVHRQVPTRTGDVCPDAPGCECRPQAPTAPEPKPGQRTTVEKSDPGRDAALGWLDFDTTPRLMTFSVPATASPPRKLPLYLRNSRLLI